MQIDWEPPTPRAGVAGAWDRFIGPGATAAEEWVQLAGGLLIGLAGVALYLAQDGVRHDWLALLVLVVIAIDIGGGIVTNATSAAKRWYHRRGQGARQHVLFVAVHGVHIALVAWLWAEDAMMYFALVYAMLLGASVLALAVPLYLQRPVAFASYALVLLAAQTPWLATAGLDWFVPLLFLKLQLSHLVREAPFPAPARDLHTSRTRIQ